MRRLIAGVIGIVTLSAVTPTFAAMHTFDVNLDGLQEVPPNASPAFGQAELTLNDITGDVSVTTGTYQDLLGNSTAVTLNGPAAVGSNGVVILSLTLDTPGATTGTFSGGGTLTAGNITDMLAGNTYINIRSNVFPSGEIRGQLLEVPEPASLGLLAVGGAALLIRRRGR